MPNQTERAGTDHSSMIFGPLNYKLLGLGLFLVIAGFTAMYLENEVSGFISLYISPIVIIAGYVTVIFAIMVRPSPNGSAKSRNAS